MEQHFSKIKRIIKGLEYPDQICISLSLKMLTFLGQWNHDQPARGYKFYFHLINCMQFMHFLSLVWDLCEIYNDFIIFGEAMCVTSGVALVLYKKNYHSYYRAHFEEIFDELNRYREENNKREKPIRDLQRKYYIEEYILTISTICLGLSLIVAICGHSLFDSTIPIRAKFPVDINSQKWFLGISVFQVVMSFYTIESIVFIDGIGGQVMSQTSLQFQILHYEFQRIGKRQNLSNEDEADNSQNIKQNLHELIKRHQDLINFGHRVNALYQPMLMAQLGCSLAMICLTAFEATLTTDDLFMFLKFAVYAVSVFIQILYWCYYGNRVSHMSSTINEALTECNWIIGDTSFRKDIMLVMLRAQKPFEFKVYGYFPISYETFIAVLSRSYSMFTLFRTVSN